MRRRAFLWVGFLLVLAGAFTYGPIFVHFPITRDVPWVNLLLFAAGAVLLGIGIARAYRRPEAYRGKILGPVLAVLSALILASGLHGVLVRARSLPASRNAPQVGQKAPDFRLADPDGNLIALSALQDGKTRAAVLIFYRGFW